MVRNRSQNTRGFFPGSVMLATILYGARYHAMCTARDEDG